MSKPEMTPEQKAMVKARKAGRTAFALLLFGGAVVSLYGVATSYFPTVLSGLVLFAASSLPLIVSAKIEKRLDKTLT